MTKIMLVEDDNNLREIYQARLAAEGYDIVAAEDGEAALAIAAKERPNLVITDVMMPKISGFEMLDILRNTDTLHDVKVIMLTALSQAEDNARAGKLGADRYLVKSQVTLEDIVKAAHDLLDGPVTDATTVADTTRSDAPAAGPAIPAPVFPAEPVAAAPPQAAPVAATDVAATPAAPAPVIDVIAAPPADDDASDSVVAPAPDEQAAQAQVASAQTVSQEESSLHEQINQFLATTPAQPLEVQPAETSAPIDESVAPADESEAEYAKDAATPDNGTMSVHEEPQPVAEPVYAQPAPVAEPAPAPAPVAAETTPAAEPQPYQPQPVAAPPAQPAGDQVVSSAIDTMMAGNAAPQTAPAPEVPQPQAAPAPAMTLPAPEPTSPQSQTPQKKVIAPLDHSEKPDIHQLLALEEAKAGAQQAAQAQTPPPVQPAPAAAPAAPPATPAVPPSPTSGLNPNQVAL